MNIDLSTGAAASPERTRRLAEALAEIARVLNHTTMDRAAFGIPSDVDRVLREVATAAARFPQLFSQAARWTALEDGAGRPAAHRGDGPADPGWAGRARKAQEAVSDLGAGPPCRHCGKPVIRCAAVPSHIGCSSARGFVHADTRSHGCEPRSGGPYADPSR